MVNLTELLQSKLSSRRLVGVVGGALLVMVAWLSGQAASLLLHSPTSPTLPVSASPLESKTLSSATSQNSLGDPVYLMGKPDIKALQAVMGKPEPISDIASTRLKLTLMGVIEVSGAGVALIKSAGKTLVVGVGEEIIKGVDLVEVYADQVVISHRGKHEKLTMESLSKGLIEASSSNRATFRAGSLTPENASALKEVGETLRKSPVAISRYVRFKALGQNGNWTAVKIWPKSDVTLFEGVGFKSGDLITAVNGRSIQEMAQEPSLWQAFLNESQFELTVERQGRPLVLSVDLN